LEKFFWEEFKLESFYSDFKKKLVEAVQADFFNLHKRMSNEEIYVGSLVVDSDVTGFFLIFNTVEYLKNKDDLLSKDDQLKKFREFLSPDELKELFGNYDGGFESTKWIPDEWGYGNHSLDSSLINEVSKILSKKTNSLVEDFIEFEKRVHEIMIISLAELKKFVLEKSNGKILFLSLLSMMKELNLLKMSLQSY
jgi:hypothetical protein